MNFIVTYTEKLSEGKEFKGFLTKTDFSSSEEAETWIANNPNIYWSQVTNSAPVSTKKKIVVEDVSNCKVHEGTLQIYHETGMERLGLVLYKEGILGPENPNFDHSKPEDDRNFKYYSSYEALKFIRSGDVLEIDGVKYFMEKDRDFAKAGGYRLSIYPAGFSTEELLQLFLPETKRAILYTKKD